MEDEDELLTTGTNVSIFPEDKTITLQNVHFQYTQNSPLMLRNVFLTIPPNKVTAIVGGSGNGKSTLLKLLVRLYKPSYGEIKMGGMNVGLINLRQWLEMCGVVMQDGKTFNDTVLNDIVLDDEHIDYDRGGGRQPRYADGKERALSRVGIHADAGIAIHEMKFLGIYTQ